MKLELSTPGTAMIALFAACSVLYLLDWPWWAWVLVFASAAAANVAAAALAAYAIAAAGSRLAATPGEGFGPDGKRIPPIKSNRPSGHRAPTRTSRWGFGVTLRTRNGFVGSVDSIYADYWSALDSFAVSPGWYEGLEITPTTKDQVWYSLVALDGDGAVLVGELDAKEA